MRQRLYEWHLKLARAFGSLSADELADFEGWQDAFPSRPDDEWPGWAAIIGERPRPRPVLAFQRERTA